MLAYSCHLLVQQSLQLVVQLLVELILLMVGTLQFLGYVHSQPEEAFG